VGRRGTVSRSRARALALLATLLLSGLAGVALAEQLAERRVVVDRSPSALVVSSSFPDLFDDAARRRLEGGFWNQVVVRVALHHVGQDQPASLAVRTCRLRYEVWEEHYEVQVEDHVGSSTRRVPSQAEAIRQCTTLDRFPVASLSAVGTGRSYVVFIAELNPVSEELLDSIRRWLRSPQGGHRRLDRGDSFFGSAVAIFVNHRIGRADRQVHFRSQTFGP
jgi:hypothetical protein